MEVWDFALPDRLSFVPQMNAYGLPDAQETAYYRLAHEHRSCLNCLRYSWQGRVADGCAPKTAADGSWDWTAWDRRFGPLLDGSAFADLPRGRTPVDNFYLPLNENWPMDHERAYRGGYWIETAYPDSYWAEFRAASGRFARHIAEKGWTQTDLRVLPQQQGLLQGRAGIMVGLLRAVDLRRAGQYPGLLGAAPLRPRVPRRHRRRAEPRFPLRYLAARVAARFARRRSAARKSSAERCGRTAIASWPVRRGSGNTVLLYGSPNKIGTPNIQCSAWCLDAWCLGADGVVPWNTIGTARSWTEPDQTCLFYPTEKGPLPSLRLKAFCHGQQLVEYVGIFTQLAGHDRRSVAEALRRELGLDGLLKKTSEDDAGTMSYDRLSPENLERVRYRLGSWIAARKPADRSSWTAPRPFGPVDARPDERFFVPGGDSTGR